MKAALLVTLFGIHLTIAASRECSDQQRQCLGRGWRPCLFTAGACSRILKYCSGKYNLCKAAKIECKGYLRQCMAKSIGQCASTLVKCSLTPSQCYRLHAVCQIATAVEGSDESETESSTRAFEVERNAGGSENPSDCDNQKALCLDKALKGRHLGKKHSKITAQVCDRSYKHCKAARESARSEMESSWSAFEVDYSASGIENPAECDSQLERCLGTLWVHCDDVDVPCTLTQTDCHRYHDLCKGAEVAAKRARSEEEARSSASETERNASSTEKPAGCGDHLHVCLESAWMNCGSAAFPCNLNPDHCYRANYQCIYGEDVTESIRSEADPVLSVFDLECIANSSGNSADCEGQICQCLESAWLNCGSEEFPCTLNPQHCYRSYQVCKLAENKSARPWAESSSSVSEVDPDISRSYNTDGTESAQSEVESTSSSSEVPQIDLKECNSRLERCLDTAWDRCETSIMPCSLTVHLCYQSFDLCKAGESECDNRQERCLDTAWIVCGSAAIPCMITSAECYRSYDLCKCAENDTQCAWPEAESISSASEVESYVNNPENPMDCNSQRTRCLDNVEEKCRPFMVLCLLTEELCDLTYDQCKNECDTDRNQCLDLEWLFCRMLGMPCLSFGDECFRIHDMCMADEIGDETS